MKVIVYALASLCISTNAQFNDGRFDTVVQKLKDTAFAFRDELESLYVNNHCDSAIMTSCTVFDECNSEFPNPMCPAGEQYQVPDLCGTCPIYVDSTTSSTRLAPGTLVNGIHPMDPDDITSLCFPSPSIDDWIRERVELDAPFWQPLGLAPSAMYFGSKEGTFRIYPARHSRRCGSYDPRLRPWYIAGGSGSKNVIMVLDRSGSMKEPRISLLKEAAKRVVDTLSVGDRVAIVPFNSEASKVAENQKFLYEASTSNKKKLHQAIDSLKPRGGTDFYAAFTAAFEILEDSIDIEAHIHCNTAILFLTDGELAPEDPSVTTELVMDTVLDKINSTEALLKHPIHLFAYSISTDAAVHEFPRNLACSTSNGIWTRVQRPQDIVEALSSYYLLFASGLGSNLNKDFAAWVEPYRFWTGDILGTTVSVPVYDRTQLPPLFLGVVGVELALSTLNKALETDDNTEAIKRLALLSSANCPVVDLEECQLEFYRKLTGGPESMCSDSCLLDEFESKTCDLTEYPSNVIGNTRTKALSTQERVCCQCDGLPFDDGKNTALVAIIVLTVIAAISLPFLCAECDCCKSQQNDPEEQTKDPVPMQPPSATAPPRFVCPVDDHSPQ